MKLTAARALMVSVFKMAGQLTLIIGYWCLKQSRLNTRDTLPQALEQKQLNLIQELVANFGVAWRSPGNSGPVELVFNRPIFIYAPEIRLYSKNNLILHADKIWMNPPMLAGVPIAIYDYWNLEDNCPFTYLSVPYTGYLPHSMPFHDYQKTLEYKQLALSNTTPKF